MTNTRLACGTLFGILMLFVHFFQLCSVDEKLLILCNILLTSFKKTALCIAMSSLFTIFSYRAISCLAKWSINFDNASCSCPLFSDNPATTVRTTQACNMFHLSGAPHKRGPDRSDITQCLSRLLYGYFYSSQFFPSFSYRYFLLFLVCLRSLISSITFSFLIFLLFQFRLKHL